MLRLILAWALWLVLPVWAAENPRDTYPYRLECPQNGAYYKEHGVADNNNFIRCQCTSYVAHKLNELWGNTSPKFTNQYYGFDRWGDAKNWFNRARSDRAEIGVTGARDNFAWDESKFNAVFPGDVAYWDTGTYGHVAFVKSATPGPGNRGVGCIAWSEYNGTSDTQYEFSERAMCRNPDGTFPSGFPKYILHIDKDRVYCKANPTVDTCATLMGRQQVAGLSKYVGGLGGGSSDPFNFKVNSFAAWNAAGSQLTPDVSRLTSGQTVTVKVQVKAKDGDTKDHMQPGKDTIEVDLYARTDNGDWVFQRRAYIKATNLPSGATHTETITYVVPSGVSEVSFKAKIDAEDEAYESNEGDNWSQVLTFQVENYAWLPALINSILE